MSTTTERLDKLAAKFNLYRADQIPAKYWEDTYFKENAPFYLGKSNSSAIPEHLKKMQGATVKRYPDNSSVWINWEGFQITFNHNKASKYMEKRVEYRGNAADVLELFKKLNP